MRLVKTALGIGELSCNPNICDDGCIRNVFVLKVFLSLPTLKLIRNSNCELMIGELYDEDVDTNHPFVSFNDDSIEAINNEIASLTNLMCFDYNEKSDNAWKNELSYSDSNIGFNDWIEE